MPIHRYFLSDFVSVQRQSFFDLLEKGLIEEFAKRNPITNGKKDYSFFFYPEYYILTRPEYKPHEAIIKNKSYTSKLFVPVQITNKKNRQIVLKWVYIGNIPLMTKRGHFILNGAARVIVNQILRSPGIYYQQKIYENYEDNQGSKPNAQEDDSSLQPVNTYKRFYCDLICMRGSWLRIEMDKEKNIWAQMKKGPKIPIYWFLLAMGLSEKVIIKSIMDPKKVFGNLERNKTIPKVKKKTKKNSTEVLGEATQKIALTRKEEKNNFYEQVPEHSDPDKDVDETSSGRTSSKKLNYPYLKNTPEAWQAIYKLLHSKTKNSNVSKNKANQKNLENSSVIDTYEDSIPKEDLSDNLQNFGETKKKKIDNSAERKKELSTIENNILLSKSSKGKSLTELGRQWIYNRFMNPRSYDLGKQGRIAFNKKLGLTIASHQLTLTGLDVLYATDYLIKVEKGIFNTDDIDHLKNRRVRTSGELIQIQIGIGLVRLEKFIRYNENMLDGKRKELIEKTNKTSKGLENIRSDSKVYSSRVKHAQGLPSGTGNLDSRLREGYTPSSEKSSKKYVRASLENFLGKKFSLTQVLGSSSPRGDSDARNGLAELRPSPLVGTRKPVSQQLKSLTSSSIINNKAFNSAIREFFGTSPLSQFMDQINPLAELTHKRRLSSMGPGGVSRDSATLAIRGIHPTHYGRICPIETPEGKNTGLVNSMTTYAMVNSSGILESPFYKVYKGQVQKNTGMYYLNAEQEEKIKLAAADLYVSPIGFLPKAIIPARIAETFTKISRSSVQYIGVSPLQMISIAASLIPFLEHDDANRALMGSNMQRQAVPLIRHERPIVGTGLEGRAVSDSGHVIQSKYSGLVTYVSAKKIIVSI